MRFCCPDIFELLGAVAIVVLAITGLYCEDVDENTMGTLGVRVIAYSVVATATWFYGFSRR